MYTREDYIEMYDEMLDECYPMVQFGNLEYYPSYVLRNVDPIAYDMGLSEYIDSLHEDDDFEDDDDIEDDE